MKTKFKNKCVHLLFIVPFSYPFFNPLCRCSNCPLCHSVNNKLSHGCSCVTNPSDKVVVNQKITSLEYKAWYPFTTPSCHFFFKISASYFFIFSFSFFSIALLTCLTYQAGCVRWKRTEDAGKALESCSWCCAFVNTLPLLYPDLATALLGTWVLFGVWHCPCECLLCQQSTCCLSLSCWH